MLALFNKTYDFAITQLSLAESKFGEANMRMYAAVTQRARGKLIGGEEGIKLVTSAEEIMKEQQIQNINTFAKMLLPGKWENKANN
jgi:hypothetical protein